ncbi:hypothetical protein [Corallococcus macrosporus]|uniref:Uncharacterized protein n=1 Tax=Myxococcus fulvus (strain ATCC BAA-855 / HW-1) TaxID=483219 RepID=F8CHN3_MYXFH|nr:hypothetical protein [Corallococcus macrosporus]AEI67534.1 hypothetical protein LILAB_28235 [Corallococcus macrosporus]
MSAPDPRKDPRFRRFRGAAYGIHILLTTLFSLWLIWSVGRSVSAMTPEKLPPAPVTLTFRECLEGARALWTELESGREKLVNVSPAKSVDQEWMRFRTAWLQKLRVRESECALDSRERALLREVFGRLVRVQDLYAIHAVQYAGEVGGAVDALHAALERAGRDPSAGRLP